jgi:hypothetical protein
MPLNGPERANQYKAARSQKIGAEGGMVEDPVCLPVSETMRGQVESFLSNIKVA